MANIKFSQLPNLGNITAATIVPVVASGINYSVTAANLQTYVNGGNGNITSGNISASGNITGGNLITGGYVSATGNVTGGNIITSGYVSAGGNVTGAYIIGNGSQLTGLPPTYTNSNVATFLAAYGSNTISTTGTVNAGNTTLGNLTISGTTTLNPYVETTAASVNTGTGFTPSMSAGPVQKFLATANFTLAAPSGMTTGQSITLIITQDATGSRVMTPNAAYKFAYGQKILSTAANSIDVMSIFYDGTNYLCNLVRGYA